MQDYLFSTLPSDIKVVSKILLSKKPVASIIFIGLMWLTVVIYLVAMSAITGGLPSLTINENYGALFLRNLLTTPEKLASAITFYWEYPAFWFTFNRPIDLQRAVQLGVMDTSISFPINIRYFVESAPLMGLVTVSLILSRYMSGINAMPKRLRKGKLTFTSLILPSGGSSAGSALAPMACCGGTVVQTAIAVLGITAPVVTLFSRTAVVLLAALLVISIAKTARKIGSGCSCTPAGSPKVL